MSNAKSWKCKFRNFCLECDARNNGKCAKCDTNVSSSVLA